MTSAPPPAARRVGAWGFVGTDYPPSPQLLEWLAAHVGPPGAPYPQFDRSRSEPPPPPRIPDCGAPTSQDPFDRLVHARGQGLTDLLRLRAGSVSAYPAAVVRPENAAQVEAVLRECGRAGLHVVPWGGGTSVTGGVTVMPGPPVVTLDLGRLARLERLDEESHLAIFGAGTLGPALEAALAPHGFTLGHFPQSWELSSLGGWIVTRASGQESLGYGSIQDLVAGVEVVAPAGRLIVPAFPASAAGPDLRQVVAGSEGRLGVVTRATVRVRPRPEVQVVTATLLPSWEAGLAAARSIVQEQVPLTLLRLSDPPETEVAMAVGLAGHARAAPLVRRWLQLRGIGATACMMLCGAAGAGREVRRALRQARGVLRRHRGVSLGTGPGRHWLADRFRHPYLRDALLDVGIATDTLETAAPWARLPALGGAVGRALASALSSEDERVAVLCHLSHPYDDGSSLYFTFFFRCPPDPEAAVARWATIKRAATEAIVTGGGTLSHHHGVGSWHAPWLEREVGPDGVRLLRSAVAVLDPAGIMNPHVLLDPLDRLEV